MDHIIWTKTDNVSDTSYPNLNNAFKKPNPPDAIPHICQLH